MEQLKECLACQHQAFTSVQKTKAMMHPSNPVFLIWQNPGEEQKYPDKHDLDLIMLEPES